MSKRAKCAESSNRPRRRSPTNASAEVQTRGQGELAEQVARFASERETLERQVEQLRCDLERARSQVGQQSSQMTVTMDQIRAEAQARQAQEWQERCAVLEADLQRTRDELAAACQARDAAGAWESRFREADRQVEHWQAEADGRRLHIEDLQQQLAAEKTRQAQADSADWQRLEEERRELSQQRESLAAREEQLGAARYGLAGIEAELKSGREALEAEQARQHAELDQQAARLQQRALDLDARAQDLADRQSALDLGREQLTQGLSTCESRQQQLAASEAELAAQRFEMDAGQAGRAAACEALAAGEAELAAQRNELAAQRDAMAAGQAELEQERTRVQRWADQIQAEADEAARRRQTGGEAAGGLARPEFAGDTTPEVERACTDSDLDDLNGVDSVLSRLVKSGRWRDHLAADGQSQGSQGDSVPSAEREYAASGATVEESPAAQPEPTPASEPGLAPSSPPLVGESECQEEESIETYMERLMQRVRGDSADPARPAIMPVLQKQFEELAAEAPVQSSAPEAQQPVKPAEYLPRSQASELSSNLAAMRELAKTAARTAIEHRHQKSDNKQAAFRLLGAGVVLLVSALLGYWAWQMSSVSAAVGASIGLLTGSLWALRGFVRMLNALKLSRPQTVISAPAPQPLAVADASAAAEPVTEA